MNSLETKKCIGPCGLEKELDCFSGSLNKCRECVKRYNQEYYKNNRENIRNNTKKYAGEHREEKLERDRKYNEAHKEQYKKYKKEYYKNNKEELSEKHRIYYKENADIIKNNSKEYKKSNIIKVAEYHIKYAEEHKKENSEYKKEYYKNNKDKLLKNNSERKKERMVNEPGFKFRELVSNSIRKALKANGSSKAGKSIIKYLTYSFNDLKSHIESLFEPWMTWENQGVYKPSSWNDNDPSTWKWQLDHIIPQSDLPYVSMEDENFKTCWSLSNLRPLSAKQNQLDGATKIRHKNKKE